MSSSEKQDELDEILMKVAWAIGDGPSGSKDLAKAKAAILKRFRSVEDIEAAIGPNVPVLSTTPGFEENVAVIANGVRIEIRKKLNLEGREG